MTDPTKRRLYSPCDILILTGSIGEGHCSCARAVENALKTLAGNCLQIDTVDFITSLENFASTATKKIYLNSLRISPKMWELVFSGSSRQNWPVKALNMLSAPFMEEKFFTLLTEKKPRLLVSAFPLWQIVIKKAWDTYLKNSSTERPSAPFVSIVTDSISIHRSWTMGQPDYFVVANEDTAHSLRAYGISPKKIKVFGYPVAHDFDAPMERTQFLKQRKLAPYKKTLLLILPVGIHWLRIRTILKAIQASALRDLQLLVIACGKETWKEKFEKMQWPWPTHVSGWTDEIHNFINAADIVLTKAGGSIVMECIASRKPMLIIGAIPGQEAGNARFVEKYGLGISLNRSVTNFDTSISAILNNQSAFEENLQAQNTPHAAEKTAQFLTSLLS